VRQGQKRDDWSPEGSSLLPRGNLIRFSFVSTVNEIESALTRLSRRELEAIRDFLDDLIEDELELSDAYKEKVARAKAEIARGEHSRTRQPGSTE
jgi:hypothetical protein